MITLEDFIGKSQLKVLNFQHLLFLNSSLSLEFTPFSSIINEISYDDLKI